VDEAHTYDLYAQYFSRYGINVGANFRNRRARRA
jgi:hypothetical protein